MGNVADKMYDGLWLGEREGITGSEKILDKQAIDLVITAQTTEEVEAANLARHIQPPRQWVHFPVDDTDEEQISDYFEKVHELLHAAKRDGKRVYIHCAAGISRSSTLVAAHLMLENNWTRKTAIEFISKRRPQVDPNDGFMHQLKILEDQIRRRLEANGRTLEDVGNPGIPGSHTGASAPEEARRSV